MEVVQDEDRVVQDIVLLQKMESVPIGLGVDNILRALANGDTARRLYRTGPSVWVRGKESEPASTKIPCTWIDPNPIYNGKWCDFRKSLFSTVYMVFGPNNMDDYLLLIKSAPFPVMLKASLQRIETHTVKSVLNPSISPMDCPDDDISCMMLNTVVSTSTKAQFVASHAKKFERGINHNTPPANTYSAFEIEGSRVVLVFRETKEFEPKEFHLTYELPTQAHTGWSAM